ncbi:MAG: trypsin-like peptidase domain-containing protein, partial [Nitriliruptoraceae bacterium]
PWTADADLDGAATTTSVLDSRRADAPTGSTTTATPAPAAPRRRWASLLVTLVVALLGAVVGTAGTLAYLADDTGDSAPSTTAEPAPTNAPSIEVNGETAVIPAVAQAVTPSVVRIDVAASGGFDAPAGSGGAIGSGVIYRSDGYVLTNNHVVAAAVDNGFGVSVRLSSGDVVDAEIVGTDELNDLAVLKVDRTGLPAINLRPADETIVVGETVVAIGSPFGLDATVTAGIVSAVNREIRADDDSGVVIPNVIQTDAAINPGNSGGALVDAEGRLVGINTAILSRSGANQGVGFAVSVEQAIYSADQIIEQGFVRHPFLGIRGIDVTPEIAEEFGLPASRGAVVESVEPDTSAAEAGLRAGDIIVEVDGEALDSMSELVAIVRSAAPGDELTLRVFRDGEVLEVDVTLGEQRR